MSASGGSRDATLDAARTGTRAGTRTVALVVASCVALAAACGGHQPTRADQNSSIAQQAGLPDDVARFFALAGRGADAVYTVSANTTDAKGQQIQVTTTQRPPDRRIDVFNADGTIDATIATANGTFQCTQTAGKWQCGQLGPAPGSGGGDGALSSDTVQRAVDQFRARAADYDFRIAPRTIANTSATCLVTDRKPGHEVDSTLGATATLCLSAEGVPLAVEVPTGSLTAIAYSTSIDPHAFDLPAPPNTTAPPASGN